MANARPTSPSRSRPRFRWRSGTTSTATAHRSNTRTGRPSATLTRLSTAPIAGCRTARETYVDGILDEFSETEHDADLDASWVKVLASLYTPARFPMTALQMGSAYIAQIAGSSTIANCAMFQTGDQFRWVSRVAYRTAELAKTHADAGFNNDERSTGKRTPPGRASARLLEKALIAYDMGESFVALKPGGETGLRRAFFRQFGPRPGATTTCSSTSGRRGVTGCGAQPAVVDGVRRAGAQQQGEQRCSRVGSQNGCRWPTRRSMPSVQHCRICRMAQKRRRRRRRRSAPASVFGVRA